MSQSIWQITSVVGVVTFLIAFALWTLVYWRVFTAASLSLYIIACLLPILGFTLSYLLAKILCQVRPYIQHTLIFIYHLALS